MERLDVFPFFLGCGRSGTTLLRAMFDSHPELAIPGESVFIAAMGSKRGRYELRHELATERFVRDLVSHWRFKQWTISEDAVRSALGEIQPATFPDAIRTVFALYASSRGKPRYGDKTPVYVLAIPLLARLFSEARFVHVIRDGRNVALSLTEMEHGPRDLGDAALYWKRLVQRGRRSGDRLAPERYREIRYEDLLERPEDTVRELCAFLGLRFDAAMLRYFERADAITGAFVDHQRRAHRHLSLPPTPGLRDWRLELSSEEVVLIESLVGDQLLDLGYECVTSPIGLSDRFRAKRRVAREQLHRATHRLSDTRSTLVRTLSRSTETR